MNSEPGFCESSNPDCGKLVRSGESLPQKRLNPFHAISLFPYYTKTYFYIPENFLFSVFRGCNKRPVAQNGLRKLCQTTIPKQYL